MSIDSIDGYEVFKLVFVTLAAAFVAGVTVLLRSRPHNAPVVRLLRDTPATRISDAPASSPVRIVGRLRFRGPSLEAPLTGRRCAYSRVRVEGLQDLLDASESVDLFVEDPTGRVLVRMAGAIVSVAAFAREDCSPSSPPTARMEALLTRHGTTHAGRTLIFYESVLEEDELVAVLGVGHWEPDAGRPGGGSGYREAPARLLVFDGAVTLCTASAATVTSTGLIAWAQCRSDSVTIVGDRPKQL